MSTELVEIRDEHIDLDQLLKLSGMAGSGGEAKFLIKEGLVIVNGEVETRRRRKCRCDDLIEVPEVSGSVRVSTAST